MKVYKTKFTPLTLAHALKLWLGGRDLKEISRITGIHYTYISKLTRGAWNTDRWKEIDPGLMFQVLERSEAQFQAKLDAVRSAMMDCRKRGG